ncbi:MAG: bifunctional folylpolyglutamate synthase/dihydrofolate synthase, partial [Actinomycetota bacterium]
AGVYTSPHLESIRERYLLMGPRKTGGRGFLTWEEISQEEFADTVGYLQPFVELVERRGETVTYFELATAVAFEWMAVKSVGVAVVEAGLGGSWDATNILNPQVATLTKVGVDHREFLGNTPLENAREKVGIIKYGARVVVGHQEEEVLALVEETARGLGAPVASLGREFRLVSEGGALSGRTFALETGRALYDDLFVPLHGAHQSANAAVAVAACEEFLDGALHIDTLRAGLAAVRCPGRMEVIREEPLVVLDGAHNPDGAGVLGPALAECFGERRRTFVISIFADKDVDGILQRLLPHADRVIFTRSSSPRASDPHSLAASSAVSRAVEVVPSLPDAIEAALVTAAPEEMVVVTGSLFAVGEARRHLLGPGSA